METMDDGKHNCKTTTRFQNYTRLTETIVKEECEEFGIQGEEEEEARHALWEEEPRKDLQIKEETEVDGISLLVVCEAGQQETAPQVENMESKKASFKPCTSCSTPLGVATKVCRNCQAKQPLKLKLKKKKAKYDANWALTQLSNGSVCKLYDETNLLLHKWHQVGMYPLFLLGRKRGSKTAVDCLCPFTFDHPQDQESRKTMQRIFARLIDPAGATAPSTTPSSPPAPPPSASPTTSTSLSVPPTTSTAPPALPTTSTSLSVPPMTSIAPSAPRKTSTAPSITSTAPSIISTAPSAPSTTSTVPCTTSTAPLTTATELPTSSTDLQPPTVLGPLFTEVPTVHPPAKQNNRKREITSVKDCTIHSATEVFPYEKILKRRRREVVIAPDATHTIQHEVLQTPEDPEAGPLARPDDAPQEPPQKRKCRCIRQPEQRDDAYETLLSCETERAEMQIRLAREQIQLCQLQQTETTLKIQLLKARLDGPKFE